MMFANFQIFSNRYMFQVSTKAPLGESRDKDDITKPD